MQIKQLTIIILSLFNENYVSQIKKGVTTKADIRTNLGDPHAVTTTSSGETWTYTYANFGSYLGAVRSTFTGGSDVHEEKELVVSFRGNVVRDYKFRKGGE